MEKSKMRTDVKDEKVKKNFNFYVCCFFVYCVIGWIYEVIWEFAIGNGFVNRGFLYGPYLPIYGFGVLTLLFLLHRLMDKKIKICKINITPILVFLAILFIVSVIEYFSSVIMELLFHKRWWDYSYDVLNLNGRISLRNSSILAAGAIVLLYVVHPILDKYYNKLKPILLKKIATIIIIVMSLDFAFTILGYLI